MTNNVSWRSMPIFCVGLKALSSPELIVHSKGPLTSQCAVTQNVSLMSLLFLTLVSGLSIQNCPHRMLRALPNPSLLWHKMFHRWPYSFLPWSWGHCSHDFTVHAKGLFTSQFAVTHRLSLLSVLPFILASSFFVQNIP